MHILKYSRLATAVDTHRHERIYTNTFINTNSNNRANLYKVVGILAFNELGKPVVNDATLIIVHLPKQVKTYLLLQLIGFKFHNLDHGKC